MSPAALYFASGDSLYPGAVLLIAAIATTSYLRNRWQVLLRNVAVWLGLAMMVMASPPFSWLLDAIFFVTLFLWLIASSQARRRSAWGSLRKAAGAILLALLLVFPVSGLFHRRLPIIQGAPGDHLVVLGDSISAGIDPRVPTWPVILQRKYGIAVKNLSRPGAGAAEARIMAAKVTREDTVVLIEIGGNDLLSGVPAHEFGQALDSLLRRLAAPERTLVMFELPLLPHWISYGQIQRRLSKRYGVFLIPKHYLTNVLSGADATSDGLHLSAVGAQRMAALVVDVLSSVLKPAVMSSNT
jgi:acyl-CoA thioesterase I